MTTKIEIAEPPADAPREVWRQHLYALMDLLEKYPEADEVLGAYSRAQDALERLDFPNGYGRKERLADGIQSARYEAGIDEIGEK